MKNKGFTLIELMIVICIMAIISITIVTMYSGLTKSTTDQRRKIVMQQNGRAALRFISNELLTAGYSPGGYAEDKIIMAETDSIIFNKPDPDTGNQVRCQISMNADNELVWTNINNGTSDVILENVAAFSMIYGIDRQNAGSDGFGELERTTGGNIAWASSTSDCIYSPGAKPCTLTSTYYYDAENLLRQGSTEVMTSDPTKKPVPITGVSINRIRAVKIILLVRSDGRKHNQNLPSRTDFRFPDPKSDDGFIPPSSLDSSFRYKHFTTTVKLRNMYYL